MCVSMYISDYCVLLLLNKNNVIFKAKVVETLFFFLILIIRRRFTITESNIKCVYFDTMNSR